MVALHSNGARARGKLGVGGGKVVVSGGGGGVGWHLREIAACRHSTNLSVLRTHNACRPACSRMQARSSSGGGSKQQQRRRRQAAAAAAASSGGGGGKQQQHHHRHTDACLNPLTHPQNTFKPFISSLHHSPYPRRLRPTPHSKNLCVWLVTRFVFASASFSSPPPLVVPTFELLIQTF